MRVPPVVVVLGAIVFKLWLAYRLMRPLDAIVLQIAAFLLLVLMFSILARNTEERRRPVELYCSDWSSERSEKGVECQFKLRDAFGASRPHEATS
jgi:hypothetical protein